MQPSFSLALSRVEWTLFATLTFRKELSESRAIVAVEKWLKRVSHLHRLAFRKLQYAIRIENGERTGRLHLHLLVVVDPKLLGYFVVPPGMASVSYKWWKLIGISRYRAVQQQTDSAVAYMTKDFDAGADDYELRKTGNSQRLIISPEALRCMRKRIGSAENKSRATNTLAQVT